MLQMINLLSPDMFKSLIADPRTVLGVLNPLMLCSEPERYSDETSITDLSLTSSQ